MSLDPHLEQEADALDATVFSGDALCDADNRRHLHAMCIRWLREISRIDLRVMQEKLKDAPDTGWTTHRE